MYELLARVFEKVKARASDPKIRRLAEKYGYRAYMVARYVEVLGWSGAQLLLEANEKPLTPTIRCNDYLIDCGELEERLEEKGYVLEGLEFPPVGFRVLRRGIGSLGGTHEYLQGYYYIQDAASMSIAYALTPEPSELIVDMAAAPGGKSTQILQLTRDKALLVAVEKSPRRIRSLRSHLQRMRFTRYIVVLGDSLRVPLPTGVDRVLLDAPSTGEGIIRRDPSRKASRSLSDLSYIHETQYKLLSRAISLVKDGGVIVYSACSLAPEEGEFVIHRVLREHPEVTVEAHGLPATPGVTSYFGVDLDDRVASCGRFWPHIHDTEGFFVCRLRVRRN